METCLKCVDYVAGHIRLSSESLSPLQQLMLYRDGEKNKKNKNLAGYESYSELDEHPPF